MAEGKIRSKSKLILGLGAVALAIVYMVTAGGLIDLQGYFITIVALVLGGVMLSEVAIAHYFNRSVYKSLTVKDFVNLVIIFFAGAVIVQGLLFIPVIKESVSISVIEFFNTVALFVGAGAVVFSIWLLSTKD